MNFTLLKLSVKRLSLIIVIISLISGNAYSKCDWKSIQKVKNGFIYSKDCHIEVGKLVKQEKLRESIIAGLKDKIKLSDLRYLEQEKIALKWRKTAYSVEDKLISNYKLSSYSNNLYFFGGVVVTILSVYAASQIKR